MKGRRGPADVYVEVDPARGQPDQPRGGEEWGSSRAGDLLNGYDMPLRKLALNHTAVPTFSGKIPESTACARNARDYVIGIGSLSGFERDPPQYIPAREFDTENSLLVYRGYSRESVHIHTLAWKFLFTVI